MDHRKRHHIQEEERLRHQTRQDLDRLDVQNMQNAIDRHADRISYVQRHGIDGAADRTLNKWLVAAAILAVMSFLRNISSGEILTSFGNSVLGFVIVAGIGFWRSNQIRNMS